MPEKKIRNFGWLVSYFRDGKWQKDPELRSRDGESHVNFCELERNFPLKSSFHFSRLSAKSNEMEHLYSTVMDIVH